MNTAIDPETLEYVPEDYFVQLPLDRLFSQKGDLHLDVGCGEGAFIVAMAKANPGVNFLGIERLVGRVRKVCRRAVNAGAGNLRVLCLESFYTLSRMLPAKSVAVVHLMFPDPWPKRKHHKNRIVNREFLDAVHAALRDDGELRLTTDDLPYFQHMEKVTSVHEGFKSVDWPEDPAYPQTDFERRFRALGLPIHRLLLRKI